MLEDLLKIYEKVPYTVKKDRLDDMLFGRHRDRIVEKVKDKVKEAIPQFPPLVTDTFNIFHKPDPQFLDDSQIAPEFRVNKRVLEKIMNTDTFSELKETTTLDDVNSAIATAILTERLYEELKSKLGEIKEHTEKIQQLRNQLPGKSGEDVKQALQQIEEHSRALQGIVTQGAVSVAVRKAQEEFEKVQNAMVALGFGNEPGKPVQVDPETAIKLASELKSNERLKKMVELLGKMRNLLKSTAKAKPRKSMLELHSITSGREIERLLPSEILKLRKYRVVFLRDYYEGRLLHYDLKRREKESKGPIVIALDLSGSMSGAKEQWAKAVSLATIDIAVKERRPWAIIAFDAGIKDVKVFRKQPKPEDVLGIMRIGASGGTNFEKPLKEAMKIVEDCREFTKADILFISDGDCKVGWEFLEEFTRFKRRRNVRVTGVLISGIPRIMRMFCDEVFALKERLDDKAAEAIFQRLV
ncbi:von Willebrand factor type A [Ferroglobus placidus DSM 10642]|uniref:von Willebrand factor type A n=1 Tax=Ferroglobus placidus (strain DSM 10642 / AEDII12DO) TaxID=589924 RepID=D3S355_FERPA|nr:VWA domain-containing protein [Ferroglobus placidus]ADC64688.1 von Willebrand factor type A [Ferroglobus placidus DSM 10642]